MATVPQTRRASTGPLRFSLFALLFAVAAIFPQLQAQTYTISTFTPSTVGAGANGATLVLTGTLPDFTQGIYGVCFYTGFGSTTPITPTTTGGVASVAVPASTIQSIPPTNFKASNQDTVFARLFVAPVSASCATAVDPALSNQLAVPVAEPFLVGSVGPTSVPQTNSTTGVQARPSNIVLSGSDFTISTLVTFGTFGNVSPINISPDAITIPVPAAFASSPVGTTAAITVCGPNSFCSASSATVTLTVAAIVPSIGTLTATPTPVTTTGTTVLTAQFKRDPTATTQPEPGVPSGQVTFSAAGNLVSTATLTLDSTATLVAHTTTTQVAATAIPGIFPPAGTYATAQSVTMADSTPGSVIYYTTDGSTPTASSKIYGGPLTVSVSETVNAIAIAPGYLPSVVASRSYTIFVPVPTSLAFVAQPVTTPTNTTITPAITVAVLDQLGNTIATSNAPVSIAISANPGSGTLTGTLTVNAVNGIATFSDLSIDNIANGYTLAASSAGLTSATSTAFNITPYPITVKLFDPLIGVTSTLPGTFTLAHPAPSPNGVLVTLTSSPTSNVTVSPATVNVPAGATTGSFTYTGVATGPATISASATGYLTGSATVTATNSLVSLGTIPSVAPGQTVDLALSIATNAPAGGVTVNFTSSNTSVATITPSVFIPAGQRTAAANPQITGVTIGTTQVNATAQGYAPDTRAVNVTVAATFSQNAVSIPHATVSTVTLNISAPAQVNGLTFTLTSTDTSKATVVSTVTIPQGQTSVAVPITGLVDGPTIIHADSPGVAEASLNVTVSSVLSFYTSNQTIGVNMQANNYVNLPTTPAAPVTITLSTNNGTSIVALSNSGTVVGVGSTLSFPNVTTAGTVVQFFLQGQAVGTTTITVNASAEFTGGATETVNVYPSGFTFAGSYNGGLSTTTFSGPSPITIYPTVLSPGSLSYSTTGTLSPGVGPISVPVTSSNTATGTVTTSPVIFNAGDSSKATTFQPAGIAGTSTIAIGTPTGATNFSTSANYNQFTATVTAPQLGFYSSSQTVGVNMQTNNYINLPVAPPSPVTVTLSTSNGASVVAISPSGTVVGVGTTLTFPNISASGNVVQFFIQGQAVGTTTLTATATGYNNATATITVYPSGFTFAGSYNGGLSTTTFSSPTTLTIYPTVLTPTSLTYSTTGTLSPGVGPISVPVTSSNPATGTITTSPVIFNAGDNSKATSFQPAGAAGTSTISIGTPTGATNISTPANYTQFTATVTAPQISFYASTQTAGVNMQVFNYINLPVAPPSPVTITLSTSNGATIVALSKSGTVVGVGTTLSFPNVSTAGSVTQFFIQGQAVGTTTLTAAAPGYTSGTATVTVYPSGFTFAGSYNGGLSTTTFSGPTTVYVYPTILSPGTLAYSTTGTLSPGVGPISVPLTSSNTTVGTIATSPLIFNPGDSQQSTTFQPAGAGASTIALGTPTGGAGFSTSSNYTQFTATVTAPQAAFYSGTQTTGVNIEESNYVSLPVAPPNPVNITITSNGPGIVTLSKTATTVGTSSVTFSNVTSAGNISQFYIQGQSVGSTTITVSAPGYTSATAAITVDPSGFTFANSYSSGLTTTTTSSPTQLTIYPSVLNPGSLTYNTTGMLNPGLGGVSVPVTSSNTNTGTITTSPLIFGDGASQMNTSFKPAATGSTTITIGVPITPGFSTPSQSQAINATVQ